MLKDSLITSLYKIGAIQFGEYTLKSGQTSPVYLNLRKIISYPDILRSVSRAMWDIVQGSEFDLVCGVPYTALPIATCISLDHNIPMIIRRKEKKDYGTKQMLEGEFKPGQTCLIIEDVITTGSSILETAAELEAAGLRVKDLVVLVDREQGGKENLAQKYNPLTIMTLTEIFDSLLQSSLLKPEEKKVIHEFRVARVEK